METIEQVKPTSTLKLIFKEKIPNQFTNDQGWTIHKIEKTTEYSFGVLDESVYVLRDPNGVEIGDSKRGPFDFKGRLNTYHPQDTPEEETEEEMEARHEKMFVAVVYDLGEEFTDRFVNLEIEMYSYTARTGRNADSKLKYSYAHFTPGTVVLLGHPLEVGKGHPNESKDKPGYTYIATVKAIIKNGPDSYLIRTKESHPENNEKLDANGDLVTHTFSNEEHAIHISHVREILKPGKGRVVFEKTDRDTVPRSVATQELRRYSLLEMGWFNTDESTWQLNQQIKKSEIFVHSTHELVQQLVYINPSIDNQHRWISEEKLYALLFSMGFARPVTKSWSYDFSDVRRVGFYVKLKPFMKWAEKNYHRLLDTIKNQNEDNAKMWDEMYRDLDDIIDN